MEVACSSLIIFGQLYLNIAWFWLFLLVCICPYTVQVYPDSTPEYASDALCTLWNISDIPEYPSVPYAQLSL